MTQPAIRAKVYNAGVTAKIVAKTTGQVRPESSRWHTENNCMKNPETAAKVSASLRRIGYRPAVRGGNGKVAPCERIMMGFLGPEWVYNFVVVVNKHAYKVDFVHPQKMLAIEIDGGSHHSPKARAKDAKKDAYLKERGFAVLRLKNVVVRGLTTFTLEDTLRTAFPAY